MNRNCDASRESVYQFPPQPVAIPALRILVERTTEPLVKCRPGHTRRRRVQQRFQDRARRHLAANRHLGRDCEPGFVREDRYSQIMLPEPSAHGTPVPATRTRWCVVHLDTHAEPGDTRTRRFTQVSDNAAARWGLSGDLGCLMPRGPPAHGGGVESGCATSHDGPSPDKPPEALSPALEVGRPFPDRGETGCQGRAGAGRVVAVGVARDGRERPRSACPVLAHAVRGDEPYRGARVDVAEALRLIKAARKE